MLTRKGCLEPILWNILWKFAYCAVDVRLLPIRYRLQKIQINMRPIGSDKQQLYLNFLYFFLLLMWNFEIEMTEDRARLYSCHKHRLENNFTGVHVLHTRYLKILQFKKMFKDLFLAFVIRYTFEPSWLTFFNYATFNYDSYVIHLNYTCTVTKKNCVKNNFMLNLNLHHDNII